MFHEKIYVIIFAGMRGNSMKKIYVKSEDNLQNILDGINEPTTIYMQSGVYRQKLKIAANDVTIIGAGRETTVITYDDYARKPHADGGEYNTFRTYTVCVTGNGVVLKNLCVENSNTCPETVGQCVALSVNSKNFFAEDVDLKSTQDTLFTAPFPDDLVVRYSALTDDPAYYDGFIPKDELYMQGGSVQLYKNCRIYGTVDYVFGCAEAYFDGCEFISLAEKRGTGFVSAPAHSLKQSRGYVFYHCEFKSGGAEKNSVYLARPWRDFGKCDFIDCKLESHVKGELFDKWNDTYRDKTARFAYCNLDCAFTPAPVGWGKQLSQTEAKEIIARLNEKIKEYNK